MRYHLYIEVPAKLAAGIAAVSKPYPTQPPTVPHVTLVGPRDMEGEEREPELVRALRTALVTFSPTTITYDGLASFGKHEYIYIVVLLTPWLACCHEACTKAVEQILKPPLHPAFRFHPHITLAARLGEREGAEIWETLKDQPFSASFPCTELVLMRQAGRDAPWHELARFPLSASTPR